MKSSINGMMVVENYRRWGKTSEKHAAQDRIFRRDGYRCLRCGSGYKLTLDHILPCANGGGSDDWNLQTLCRPCNLWKGNRYINFRKELEEDQFAEMKRILHQKYKTQ